MAVNLSPIGGVAAQFFDNSGNILSGGKIYTYTAGTTTPQTTYTSAGGATAHSNPIILDAAGRVPGGEIWLTDGLQYKFLIKTSTDVQIGSYDNILGINSNFVNYTTSQEIQTATAGQTVFTLTTMVYQPGTNSLSVFVDGVNQYGPGALYAFQETSDTVVTFTAGLHVGAKVKFTTSAINASSYGNAEQVSYVPPFTGSVATNVEFKLAQIVSVKDFGAVGNGAVDDTDAVQAAFNYALSLQANTFSGGSGGVTIYFPRGIYNVTDLTLAPASGLISTSIAGEGRSSELIYKGVGGTCLTVKNNNLFRIVGLMVINNSTGTNTGIKLQTTTPGSSSTNALLQNVQILGFAENLVIGSVTDNAASEVLCMNVTIGGQSVATNGIVVRGATPNTNSLSLHFINCAVNTCTYAFQYSGSTSTSNNSLTFTGFEASDCDVDFRFDTPCHVTINGHHSEGSTVGWKLIETATGTAACPPMYMSFDNANCPQASGVDSILAWPGSYSFNSIDLQSSGLTVGDTASGNRYQLNITGKTLPITYAPGSQSVIFVNQLPASSSGSNNQSVGDLAMDYYDTTGTKRTLLTWDYSQSPLLTGLKFGTQWAQTQVAPTYGTTVNIDASLGSFFTVTATNATAFLIAAPTNGQEGQTITIRVRNTSGGALGTVSWASAYKKAAFTEPANGFSRAITFEYIGAFTWVEISQTSANIPN